MEKLARPTTLTIDTNGTKVIMQRMFDITSDKDSKSLVAYALCAYCSKLRENQYMEASFFDDEIEAKRRIFSWLDLKDTRLPGTYEKYLLLARLFNCEVNDILCIENAEAKVRNYSFSLKLDSENGTNYRIYLPIIRQRLKKSGRFRTRFVSYSDNEDALAEKLNKKDGLSLADRIINYYQKHGFDLENLEAILEYLKKNVVSVWRDGRYLIGMEMLYTFSQITGINYNELYGEEDVLVDFDLSLHGNKYSKPNKMFCENAQAKRLIERFLDENSCTIFKTCKDYLVTANSDKTRFGLIAHVDGQFSYLPTEYDYVVKSKETIYAVKDSQAISVKAMPIERLELEECSTRPFVQNALMLIKTASALNAIRNGNTLCIRAGEDVLVINPDSHVSTARRLKDNMGNGENLKINVLGKEYYGYMDENELIIPPIYDTWLKRGENIYTIKKAGKYGFLDERGFIIIDAIFSDASVFSDGLAVVMIDGKYGYIDTSGQIVIQPVFDYACDFFDGMACVTINNLDGYINKSGELVIKPQFACGFRFSEGVAAVKIASGKYGYIDKSGSHIIKPIYEAATLCTNGVVSVLSAGNLIKKIIRQAGYI